MRNPKCMLLWVTDCQKCTRPKIIFGFDNSVGSDYFNFFF